MNRKLSSQGARGGAVTIAGQAAKLLIQIVSVSILSRLLAPEDFGLIAMTAVFIQLGSLIRDSGMPTAAIQVRSLSHNQASNLFWINTALGVTGAVLLTLATPFIVLLYDEPKLSALMPVMALTLLLGGVSAQARVQMVRAFKFTSLAMVEITSQVIGLLAAILGAVLGFGYWALAWQAVAVAVSTLILQSISSRWIPALPKRSVGTKKIAKSGLDYAATGLLTFFSSNTDSLVIGAKWGAEPLGFYNRAFQLLTLPIQGMLAPLTNVVVPITNKARDSGKTIDSVLLRVQFLMGSVAISVYMVGYASAEYSIPLLLGPGWENTIAIFKILAFAGLFRVFSFVSYWGFILHQQSRQLLHYNLVTKLLTVAAVIIGALHSVQGAALAYAIAMLISWPINLIWLAKSSHQNSMEYFRNGMRIIICAVFGAVVSLLFVQILGNYLNSDLIGLLITASVSLLSFILLLVILPGGLREIKQTISVLSNFRI